MAIVRRAEITFKSTRHTLAERSLVIGFNYVGLDSPKMTNRGQSFLFQITEDTFNNVTVIFKVLTLTLTNFSFGKKSVLQPLIAHYDSLFLW